MTLKFTIYGNTGVVIDESTVSTIVVTLTDDSLDDSVKNGGQNGPNAASLGTIVGMVVAAISVVYCCMIHHKTLTCRGATRPTDEHRGEEDMEPFESSRAVREQNLVTE